MKTRLWMLIVLLASGCGSESKTSTGIDPNMQVPVGGKAGTGRVPATGGAGGVAGMNPAMMNPPVMDPPMMDPPVMNPPVMNPPMLDPPVMDPEPPFGPDADVFTWS